MSALTVLGIAILCYLVGIVLPVVGQKQEATSVFGAGVLGIAGGVLGVIASGMVLLSGETITAQLPIPAFFPDCLIRFGALSGFMVLVISIVAIACSIYSLSYMREYLGKNAHRITALMNGFIPAMLALVVSDNGFYFVVLLEVISLTSYFLVRSDDTDTSRKAANQYLMLSSIGSVLVMLAFAIFYVHADSLNFSAFHQADLTNFQASIIFLLAFVGFGFKAGVIVLHRWLPTAEPVAPSHASAMMSGVMVKIGIFGIIKVSIEMLGATHVWWGYLVLTIGCLSAVFGVLYALAEHNIKSLLAYHTIENIGIILMGVGVCMIGMANHHPILAALGLLGALYHVLNHAVFKGLLFLGAGSIIYRLHTKDMEKMGGLAKLMPYTALVFLIGTIAISALPPLNGFVSEWFIYQSLFTMAKHGTHAMTFAAPIAVVMLALTGALACMCFVKVYGICFSGAPRSEAASKAREVPVTMIIGMAFLAILCLLLGIASPWIAPSIAEIAAHIINAPMITVTQGALLIPNTSTQAVLSTPVITITLILLLIVPFVLRAVFKCARLSRRQASTPWTCGYAYEERMSVSAGGFTLGMRQMFAPWYSLRKWLDPAPTIMSTVNKLTALGGRRLEGMMAYYVYAIIVIVVVLFVSVGGVK